MRYRTKDGNDYTLPNIGMTVNGIIETNKIIENPLFELVKDDGGTTPETPPVTETPTVPPGAEVTPQTPVVANPTVTPIADSTPATIPVDVVQIPPVIEQPATPVTEAPVPPAPQVNEQKEQI
jgi:hypothetical protein